MNSKGKTASAIAYNPGESAPRLVARGRDYEAERIIAIAQEAGVTIVEDPALAALLDGGVKTGDVIPIWCWELAAKALAFALSKERR
jgi:flagellar biosynthesis protein